TTLLPYTPLFRSVVGLEYMAKAGYDPRASIYLWKNMSGVRQSPPEFLSTHPSDDRRLDDLVKSLRPALIEYNAAREAGRIPNCRLSTANRPSAVTRAKPDPFSRRRRDRRFRRCRCFDR